MDDSVEKKSQRTFFGKRTVIKNPYLKADESPISNSAAVPMEQDVPDAEGPGGAGRGHGLQRPYGKEDALLPISIVGGLCGMLVGTLPAAIWVLIFGKSFSPMFVFLPLTIFWGITSFKGCRQERGFVVTCVFSVIGFYLTLLSCQAALYVLKYEMLFLNLPFVTATLIGRSDTLPGPVFSSAYVFPFLFTLLGIFLVYELTNRKETLSAEPRTNNNK